MKFYIGSENQNIKTLYRDDFISYITDMIDFAEKTNTDIFRVEVTFEKEEH